jgi:Tol biopolymer transport system component
MLRGMRRRTTLGITAAFAAALVCCSLATDFNGLEGPSSPAEGGSNSMTDASMADATTRDGQAGDGPAVDAGGDATSRTTCDPTAPFNAPVPLTEANTSSDDTGARLTPDELTLYFASGRGGDFDLYRMKRASTSVKFSGVAPITELNTPHNERSASPDLKDVLLMFDSDMEGGSGGRDIYLASRGSATGQYQSVSEQTVLNAGGDDSRCFLMPGALTVYFESDRSGAGDIYRASRGGLALPFGTPTLVSELATSAEEGYPVVSPDQLVIYFARMASGNLDVWRASRASTNDPFGAAIKVTELATPNDDIPTWISADLCRLYMMSDRSGGSGNLDIYVATRSP